MTGENDTKLFIVLRGKKDPDTGGMLVDDNVRVIHPDYPYQSPSLCPLYDDVEDVDLMVQECAFQRHLDEDELIEVREVSAPVRRVSARVMLDDVDLTAASDGGSDGDDGEEEEQEE